MNYATAHRIYNAWIPIVLISILIGLGFISLQLTLFALDTGSQINRYSAGAELPGPFIVHTHRITQEN